LGVLSDVSIKPVQAMTVAEGPTLFGVPLLTFFGLLGYLIAFVNSLWIILSIWRSGRR
jgi:ubiquinone biosynthesis protein